MDIQEKYAGVNISEPTMEVSHSELTRSDDASDYRSICPVCEHGVLLVQRDTDTMELMAEDICILCGQRFTYSDIGRGLFVQK
jgi:hypothetical protein